MKRSAINAIMADADEMIRPFRLFATALCLLDT